MPPGPIGSAIALGLLIVLPGHVLAQGAWSSTHDPAVREALGTCARPLTQCILGGAPVLDAPFTAEATTTWRPPANRGQPEMRATSRYYRDRAGRVRVEQDFAGADAGPQRIFVTPDPDGRQMYDLDPKARTATAVGRGGAQGMVEAAGRYGLVLPLRRYEFISFFEIPENLSLRGPLDAESLGRRRMEGLETTGTRFVFPLIGETGSGRAERWVSQALGLVVYSRAEDAIVGVVEYRLTNIRLVEPRAEMFAVPPGYLTVPHAGELVFHNAYKWAAPDRR
jgi:hypothetical protein